MAKSVCFYFQVHQPFRLSKRSLLNPSADTDYFTGISPHENKEVFEKVAEKSYLPMTNLLLELIENYGDFEASFSLSGVFLDQCLAYGETGKKVLKNFQKLAQSKRVELLGETYYHSLSFLHSKAEFVEQVMEHHKAMYDYFLQKPKVFRHTELIYNNELATCIYELGYKGIIAEGWPVAMEIDHPNYLHQAKLVPLHKEDEAIMQKIAFRDWTGLRPRKGDFLPVLTKNFQLSDDMAFRFGDKNWASFPLNADTYADWVLSAPGDTVNLFMDFETFGEHQWEDTGIFEFFRALPEQFAARGITFRTPSRTVEAFETHGEYDAPHWISWADESRDISAWLENDLQRSAFDEIRAIEALLHPYRGSRKKLWKNIWYDFRRLQTSDHLYYMSTKYWADGDVHTYFSPYDSPYDAYINFMNVLTDLKTRITQHLK